MPAGPLDPKYMAHRTEALKELRRQMDKTSPPPTERHAAETLDGMVRNMRPTSEAEQLVEIAAVCMRRRMELLP